MKKISFLIAILLTVSFAFGQEDGSTLEQPIRPPLETPWIKENIGEFSEPVPYVYQRESDVFQSVTLWRIIDLREKMNHPLYFPLQTQGTWRSLSQVILDAIDIENPDNPDALRIYTDEFCNVPSDLETVLGSMSETKTVNQYDPETGEYLGADTYAEQHDLSQFLYYRIKEVWFFDKQRSLMEVRILAIVPIIEYVRETDAYMEEDEEGFDGEAVSAIPVQKRMGFIMYDELRPYLAKQDVFNMRNNAQRLSFDDLLTFKRQFSSFVFSRDNVYNRDIADYIANPRDQKLESERILNEIRVSEHDLWEF